MIRYSMFALTGLMIMLAPGAQAQSGTALNTLLQDKTYGMQTITVSNVPAVPARQVSEEEYLKEFNANVARNTEYNNQRTEAAMAAYYKEVEALEMREQAQAAAKAQSMTAPGVATPVPVAAPVPQTVARPTPKIFVAPKKEDAKKPVRLFNTRKTEPQAE